MLEKINQKTAPKEFVNALINLYYLGEFLLIIEKEKQFPSLFKDSIEVLNIFGSTNLAIQNYKKAITNFNKAIKLNPNVPTIYYNLGLANHHIGNMDDAIMNYKKAIDIKPDYDEALNNMGMSLEEKGDFALEEERRLAYVGITRAKKNAHISFAMQRSWHGEWMDSLPSRFVSELPEEGVEKNEEPIKEISDDFDFNQDNLIDNNNEYRSPGWARLKKKLTK